MVGSGGDARGDNTGMVHGVLAISGSMKLRIHAGIVPSVCDKVGMDDDVGMEFLTARPHVAAAGRRRTR